MGWRHGFEGFGGLVSPSCKSMVPTPYADASVWTINGLSYCGWVSTGFEHISVFRVSKAFVWVSIQIHCNAPTGVKGQTLAKRVRLLGKSTESYGKPAMTRCRFSPKVDVQTWPLSN